MYVIKIGGGAAIDEAAYARFADDLAELHEAGTPFVVIHGGNAEFSRLSAALGMPPRMITNDKGRVSRYTDRETIDAMLMTYCGKVNKTIVDKLPMSVSGLSSLAIPILGVLFAWGVLGEAPSPPEWAGIALIGISLATVAVRARPRP